MKCNENVFECQTFFYILLLYVSMFQTFKFKYHQWVGLYNLKTKIDIVFKKCCNFPDIFLKNVKKTE